MLAGSLCSTVRYIVIHVTWVDAAVASGSQILDYNNITMGVSANLRAPFSSHLLTSILPADYSHNHTGIVTDVVILCLSGV